MRIKMFSDERKWCDMCSHWKWKRRNINVCQFFKVCELQVTLWMQNKHLTVIYMKINQQINFSHQIFGCTFSRQLSQRIYHTWSNSRHGLFSISCQNASNRTGGACSFSFGFPCGADVLCPIRKSKSFEIKCERSEDGRKNDEKLKSERVREEERVRERKRKTFCTVGISNIKHFGNCSHRDAHIMNCIWFEWRSDHNFRIRRAYCHSSPVVINAFGKNATGFSSLLIPKRFCMLISVRHTTGPLPPHRIAAINRSYMCHDESKNDKTRCVDSTHTHAMEYDDSNNDLRIFAIKKGIST